MKLFCFILSIIPLSISWSQKTAVEFNCSIYDLANESPAANVNIFILENSDTVYSGKSDENGKFKVRLALDKSKKWKTIASLYSRKSELTIYDPKDSCQYNFDHLVFSFDLGLLKYCTLGYPTIYYETNSIDITHSYDQDFESLSELIKEYPDFKIEFFQTISKKEKPGVTEKRMALFKSYLEKSGVPISNITFSDKVYYIVESEPDQRARMEGIVKSFGN